MPTLTYRMHDLFHVARRLALQPSWFREARGSRALVEALAGGSPESTVRSLCKHFTRATQDESLAGWSCCEGIARIFRSPS